MTGSGTLSEIEALEPAGETVLETFMPSTKPMVDAVHVLAPHVEAAISQNSASIGAIVTFLEGLFPGHGAAAKVATAAATAPATVADAGKVKLGGYAPTLPPVM
jgi:hypothetical protein